MPDKIAPPTDAEYDAKHAAAFRDLESSLYDLRHMATIASELIEDFVIDIKKGHDRPSQHDLLPFAVFHVESMTKDLMQKWRDGF